MEIHPLAQKYPLMDEDTFATFKADILANGCAVPIWTFEGKILDGRNRYQACVELGITPRFEVFEGTEVEAEARVDSWNLHRRHLTTEFRRQRVQELRDQQMSTRQIARTLKVAQSTVMDDIKAGERVRSPESQEVDEETPSASDQPEATPAPGEDREPVATPVLPWNPPSVPSKVTGQDGKQYPARKPKTSATKAPKPQPSPTSSCANQRPEGIVKANEAINILKRIARNDPKRQRGFRIVTDWIKANPGSEPEPDSSPTEESNWLDILAQLGPVARLIESAPAESKDLTLSEVAASLEKTGRALVRKAKELRKQNRLRA